MGQFHGLGQGGQMAFPKECSLCRCFAPKAHSQRRVGGDLGPVLEHSTAPGPHRRRLHHPQEGEWGSKSSNLTISFLGGRGT